MNTILVLFGALAGLGGFAGFASFLQYRSQNKKLLAEGRKLDIDGDAVMTDKALEMYEAMVVRTQNAEKKADDAERKASLCIQGQYELIEHIYLLRREMASHNIEPPPFRFPSSITGAGVM